MFGKKRKKQEQLIESDNGQSPVVEGKNKKEPKQKKEPKETVKLKKSIGIRTFRIIFYLIFGFIMIRGIVTLVKGDPINAMEKKQVEYQASIQKESVVNSKAFGFAESFASQYFNFKQEEKNEYKERLAKFMDADAIRDISISKESFTTSIQAYDIKTYSKNQVDVYVYASVTKQVPEVGSATVTPSSQYKYVTEDVYIKVPIYYDTESGDMVVEDIPLIVGKPDVAIVPKTDMRFDTVASTEAITIKTSLNDFLKNYYESKQTQVDYFLIEPGKIKTAAVGTQYKYDNIETCEIYKATGDNRYLAVIKYKILDDGVENKQKVNVILQYTNGRYMIENMNTRTTNFNIN